MEDANEMLRLPEEAEIQNKGVSVMNGKFIGPLIVIAAKKILGRHPLVNQKERKRLKFPFKRQM